MKIGYLTDGDAEIQTIIPLLRRTASSHTFIRTLRTSLQITTRIDNVAASTRKGILQLKQLGAEAVIVILDRETSSDCAPLLAHNFCNVLQQAYGDQFNFIDVVIKDRTFENWLVADINAINSQRSRFALNQRARRAIEAGNADHIDAQSALKEAALKHDYSKLVDAQRIVKAADPARMAVGSRSFRRLLRASGDPTYAIQSKLPASPLRPIN